MRERPTINSVYGRIKPHDPGGDHGVAGVKVPDENALTNLRVDDDPRIQLCQRAGNARNHEVLRPEGVQSDIFAAVENLQVAPARVRQRIKSGVSPRDILREVSDRADASWRDAEAHPEPEQ